MEQKSRHEASFAIPQFSEETAESLVLLERTAEGNFRVCHANPEFVASALSYGMDAYDAYSFLRALSGENEQAAVHALHATIDSKRFHQLSVPVPIGATTHWFEIKMHPWPGNGALRILVLMRDVTEVRERRNELRMLKRAIDQWSEGVAVVEMHSGEIYDRTFSYINRRLCAIFGLAREEIAKTGVLPYLLTDDLGGIHRESLANALRSGDSFQMEVHAQLADGSRPWIAFELFPLTDTSGHPGAWLLVCRDITAQRSSSDTIGFLQSIVDEAGDLVIVTDAPANDRDNPSINYANPAFEAFIGADARSLQHLPLLSLLSETCDPRLVDSMRSELHHLKPIAHELPMRRFDGSNAWMECTARVLCDDSNTPTGWLWLGRDISTRRDQYRQTAELVTALDLTNEPIAIYRLQSRTDAILIHENNISADDGRYILPWMIQDERQRVRIPWERLEGGEHFNSLVRFDSGDGEPQWYVVELRPMLSSAGELESLIVIRHTLGERAQVRRPALSAEAVLLAHEVLANVDVRDRIDAIVEIITHECNAEVAWTRAGLREGDASYLKFGADRCTVTALFAAGILDAEPIQLIVSSSLPFRARVATALRVFLESLFETQH